MTEEKKFKISQMFEENIKRDGWTIAGVIPNSDGGNDIQGLDKNACYVYTIAATSFLGCELLIAGKIAIQQMQALIIAVEPILKAVTITEGEYKVDAIKVNSPNGPVPLRFYLKEITGESVLDEIITNRADNFNKVFQLYYGDTNNGLPTDEGNIDEFSQVIHIPESND